MGCPKARPGGRVGACVRHPRRGAFRLIFRLCVRVTRCLRGSDVGQ